MLFNRKFSNLLLILALVFLISAQLAEAGGVAQVITPVVDTVVAAVKAVTPLVVVGVIVVAGLATGGVVAQLGLAFAPGIFTTLIGTAIVGTVIVGSALLVSDCAFDKGTFSENPIDPNIICTPRERGTGVSVLSVDVRVNGSDGPVEFTAPASFKIQWVIAGPAESCSATGDWSGDVTAVRGEAEMSNAQIGNYSYGIRCTGVDQESSDSVIVKVVSPLPALIFKGPDIVEIPDSITLFWATERADSLIASGDWSGNKQPGPLPYKSETLTKPRGSYTFVLTASNSMGSATSQVNARVIQVPRCTFTANPTSIILPQSSTLSWSCQYADSCSIDQGIGSVNNVAGTKEVRPPKTTIYTLTCDSLDASRSYQATVNVGFTPWLREVIPR